MLYHFAITPDVFEPDVITEMTPPGVVLLQLLRGIEKNGLLADLHAGQWMTHVRRNQSDEKMPPAVRDRVEACFSVLHDRNRIIRHPSGSAEWAKDDFRWLRWSLERHHSDPANPMSGIFASDDYVELSSVEDDILIRLSMALDCEKWLNRPASARFTKTESNLQTHLAPIVRYAQKVSLIDPFMTCRKDRFFNTVQYCASALGFYDGVRHPGLIHIHAGDPRKDRELSHRESVKERLDRWGTALTQVASHFGHSFRVLLWQNRPGGKTFHDRYLVTDQCGIDARGGLDFLDDETRANVSGWTWLESNEIEEILLEEFHRSKSPYKYLGSRLVEP